MGPAASNDHLIDIGVHDQIGVVRHDDDLTPAPRFTEATDKTSYNGLGIKILFRLINEQGTGVVSIYCEVEKQQNDSARSG